MKTLPRALAAFLVIGALAAETTAAQEMALPGPPDHFDVQGWLSELTAGDAIPAFWLIARDRFGNVAESFDGLVDLMLGGDLLGVLGPAAAGQVFFSGGGELLEDAGVFAIVARATEFGVETSLPPVTVRPGGLDHFEVPGWPEALTAGDPLGPLMIRAMDRFGNLVTTFDAGVEVFVNGQGFGSTDPALFGETPFTTFGDAIYEAGSYSVLLRSPDFGVETVLPAVTVRPGPISGLALAGLGAEIQAGSSFGAFAIKIVDRYGNVVPGFRGTVELHLGDSVVAEYGWFVDGVVSVVVDRAITVSGTYTFVVRDALGLPVVFDAGDRPIRVLPGSPVRLTIRSGNLQQGYPGESLAEPLRVRAEDAYGNGVPNTTVDFSVRDPGVELVREPLRGARVTVATGPTGEADVRAFLTDEVPDTAKVEAEIPMYPSASHATFQIARSMNVVITRVSGENQVGLVADELPQPLVVKVTTPAGRPVGGYFVDFEGPGACFAVEGYSFIFTGGDGLCGAGHRLPNIEPGEEGSYVVTARVRGSGSANEVVFPLTARYPVAGVTEILPLGPGARMWKLHAIRVSCDLRAGVRGDLFLPRAVDFQVDSLTGPARFFIDPDEVPPTGRFTGIIYPEAVGDVSVRFFFPQYPIIRVWEAGADGTAVQVRRGRLTIGPLTVVGEPTSAERETTVYTSSNGQLTPHQVSGNYYGDGVSARPLDGASGNLQIAVPGEETARPLRLQILDARLAPRVWQWNTSTAALEPFEVVFSGPGAFRDGLTGARGDGMLRVRVSTEAREVARQWEEGPDTDSPVLDEQGNPVMVTIPAGTAEVYFTPFAADDPRRPEFESDGDIVRVFAAGEIANSPLSGRVVDYATNLTESAHFIVLTGTLANVVLLTDSNNDGTITTQPATPVLPPGEKDEPRFFSQYDDSLQVKNPVHMSARIMSFWHKPAGTPPPAPIQFFATDPPPWPGRVIQVGKEVDKLTEVRLKLTPDDVVRDIGLLKLEQRDPAQPGVGSVVRVWRKKSTDDPNDELRLPYEFPSRTSVDAKSGGVNVFVEGVNPGVVLLQATHFDKRHPDLSSNPSDTVRFTVVQSATQPHSAVAVPLGDEAFREDDVLPAPRADLSIGIYRHAEEWMEPKDPKPFLWPNLPMASTQIVVGATLKRTFVPDNGNLRWIQRFTRTYAVSFPLPGQPPVTEQVIYQSLDPMPLPKDVYVDEPRAFNYVSNAPSLTGPIDVEIPFYFPDTAGVPDNFLQGQLGGTAYVYLDGTGHVATKATGKKSATPQSFVDDMLEEGYPNVAGSFEGGSFVALSYDHQFRDWTGTHFGFASGDRMFSQDPARLRLTNTAGLEVSGLESVFETALVYHRPAKSEVVILNAFTWGSKESIHPQRGWTSTPRSIKQSTSGPNQFGSADFRGWIRVWLAGRIVEE